jgi:hypothetical protein
MKKNRSKKTVLEAIQQTYTVQLEAMEAKQHHSSSRNQNSCVE